MPKQSIRPTFTYRAISWILFPAALLFTLFVAIKHRNSSYFYQRLGIYSKQANLSSLIWCHCASVGEINTALPLLNNLITQGKHLLISTNTVTGQNTLLNAKLKNSIVIFLPLDYAYCAKKLMRKFLPTNCLLFETELWPNILLAAANYSVAITIVNGRIGNKTKNAPQFLLINYRRVLQQIKKIFASSQHNAQQFEILGASKDKIEVLDNLKFALPITELPSQPRPLGFPYLLCASTHANEEQQIIQQWQQRPRNIGLVIAIRHPQRREEVCKVLREADLDYVLHSQNPDSISTSQVYLLDTLGELMPFMTHAELVFMGGSLINLGGHNVLEPARFNRCILTGPHYQNFMQIVDELVKENGIIIIKDAADLVQRTMELMQDKNTRLQLGSNAKRYVESKQDILEKYTQSVNEMIQTHSE